MTASNRPGNGELPIGRRMAQLRVRRGMSQQVFADRVGKSKSWVDKVERGLRTLDRLSVIETVASVLGVAPEVLTGQTARRAPATDVAGAVERMRAALACYDLPETSADRRQTPTSQELDLRVGYAWTAYRHAHHPQVLRMLPDLLADTRHAHQAETATGPRPAAGLLVRVYRLAAQVLVKLGEADLAWLAADRAMATAAGDPRRTAAAAIPLAQALRALKRGRLAMAATITAAHQLAPPPRHDFPPDDLALAGTLLIEAALAAATCGDATAVRDLTDHAAHLAATHGDRRRARQRRPRVRAHRGRPRPRPDRRQPRRQPPGHHHPPPRHQRRRTGPGSPPNTEPPT